MREQWTCRRESRPTSYPMIDISQITLTTFHLCAGNESLNVISGHTELVFIVGRGRVGVTCKLLRSCIVTVHTGLSVVLCPCFPCVGFILPKLPFPCLYMYHVFPNLDCSHETNSEAAIVVVSLGGLPVSDVFASNMSVSSVDHGEGVDASKRQLLGRIPTLRLLQSLSRMTCPDQCP